MIGNKMIDIGRAADMIWIALEDEVIVHLQVETAIWLDDRLLTQMEDIYEETGLQDERWNRPQTLFDVRIAELLHLHREFFVSNIITDDDLNMEINFTGGLRIKTLPDKYCGPEDEKWRIFINDSPLPHMVAEGNKIEWI